MPITVKWANEHQNIMVTTFVGEWDLSDFHQMVEAGAQLLKDVDYPFVTVVDYTQSTTPPRKTLTIGRHVDRAHNANRLKVIFVNPGFFVEQLYSMLGKLYSSGFGDAHTVKSVEEAITLAQKLLQEAQDG